MKTETEEEKDERGVDQDRGRLKETEESEIGIIIDGKMKKKATEERHTRKIITNAKGIGTAKIVETHLSDEDDID